MLGRMATVVGTKVSGRRARADVVGNFGGYATPNVRLGAAPASGRLADVAGEHGGDGGEPAPPRGTVEAPGADPRLRAGLRAPCPSRGS
jgi:hypothetical protein